MSYKKREKSPEVTKASKRLDKIKTVETNFDLGNGLTQAAYEAKIKEVEEHTALYNLQLTQVDTQMINLEQQERELADLTDRMLKGVGMKYGFDSIEYEKAGGTPKGNKKRSSSSANVETPAE